MKKFRIAGFQDLCLTGVQISSLLEQFAHCAVKYYKKICWTV